MKSNLKKNIAMVMASVMMAGTFAMVEPVFNTTSVYASSYTHEQLVTYTVPENAFIRSGWEYINNMEIYLGISEGFVSIKYTDNEQGTNIDKTGKELFPLNYSWVNPFDNGLAVVTNSDYKRGIVDKTGKEIVPVIYDLIISDFSNSGLALVQKDKKYGFINATGNVVIPMEYDFAQTFSDGIAIVSKDEVVSYIDTSGAIIKSFTDITPWDLEDFSDGLARMNQDGKWGYIDKTGAEVIPAIYDNAEKFSNGFAKVTIRDEETKNSSYGLIDKTGNLVVDFDKYDNIGRISEGLIYVTKGDAIGFIDTTGQEVIPLQEYVTPKESTTGSGSLAGWGFQSKYFSEGLASVVKYDKHGYIDKTGADIIPAIYDEAWGFSEGLAIVKKDDKYGYIDKTGAEIIPCIYSDAMDFVDGIAVVEIDKQQYIIQNPLTSGIAPSTSTPTETPAETTTSTTVSQTNSTVLINGKQVDFQAYNIDGNNYFKLRDIAEVLKGSEKQFEVAWNGDKKAMELTSKTAYTTVGGELANSGIAPTSVKVTSSSMFVDGKAVDLQAYNIDDNNYFKLRDLGALFNFGIGWDGTNKVVTVNTSESYTD